MVDRHSTEERGKINVALMLSYHIHQRQLDKIGEPYFAHPMRIAIRFKTSGEKIISLLHDVLEDSDIKVDTLLFEYAIPAGLVHDIVLLTKISGETYKEYCTRIATSPRAARIKIEDLRDNLDTNRLDCLTPEVRKRLEQKYIPALKFLLEIPNLYEEI